MSWKTRRWSVSKPVTLLLQEKLFPALKPLFLPKVTKKTTVFPKHGFRAWLYWHLLLEAPMKNKISYPLTPQIKFALPATSSSRTKMSSRENVFATGTSVYITTHPFHGLVLHVFLRHPSWLADPAVVGLSQSATKALLVVLFVTRSNAAQCIQSRSFATMRWRSRQRNVTFFERAAASLGIGKVPFFVKWTLQLHHHRLPILVP